MSGRQFPPHSGLPPPPHGGLQPPGFAREPSDVDGVSVSDSHVEESKTHDKSTPAQGQRHLHQGSVELSHGSGGSEARDRRLRPYDSFSSTASSLFPPFTALDCIKCVVVGNSQVGKSSLIQTYMRDQYSVSSARNVLQQISAHVDVDGQKYRFDIYDTAGDVHNKKMRMLSYAHTDVFIICFALDDRKSFDDVESVWLEEIAAEAQDRIPIVLVGTKSDLDRDEADAVTMDEAMAVAKKMRRCVVVNPSALSDSSEAALGGGGGKGAGGMNRSSSYVDDKNDLDLGGRGSSSSGIGGASAGGPGLGIGAGAGAGNKQQQLQLSRAGVARKSGVFEEPSKEDLRALGLSPAHGAGVGGRHPNILQPAGSANACCAIA